MPDKLSPAKGGFLFFLFFEMNPLFVLDIRERFLLTLHSKREVFTQKHNAKKLIALKRRGALARHGAERVWKETREKAKE